MFVYQAVLRAALHREPAGGAAEEPQPHQAVARAAAPPRRAAHTGTYTPPSALRPPPSGTDSTHKTRSARDIACLVLLMMLGNFQRGH